MKCCKNITCWTDYPFEGLGDKPNQLAPIRHVYVRSFDGNKYAEIEDMETGVRDSIKAGYLYGQRGRWGKVPTIAFRKLERMVQP